MVDPLLLSQTSFEEFFSRMFEDVLAGRVTLESVLLVLSFFGTFVLLTMFSFIFAKKPKELMPSHPITWITDYGRIVELLESAVTQRSKVRVSFHRDLGVARSTDGTLVDVDRKGLLLEVTSIKTVNPDWVGRTLELSFKLQLPEQPKVQSIFAFVAEIVSYQQAGDNILQLKLSRPLRLELNQNRLHLRVEPSAKYVKIIKLWTGESIRRKGDPKAPDTWGDPIYHSEAGGKQEIMLQNISGGGLRLEITPGALRAIQNTIAVNQDYYGQLVLAHPDLSGYSTHYILMRVLKCYDDCESKYELSLGMVFSAEGTPYAPPLVGLNWRNVNRDFGIRSLDDWAYEMHLEQYRNKGIA